MVSDAGIEELRRPGRIQSYDARGTIGGLK
jgi:hypothetical protein